MEMYDNSLERDASEEELLDEGSISAEEEAFMRGYSDDEEISTCEECGAALGKKVVKKEIDGETHRFCSELCAKEYEESIG